MLTGLTGYKAFDSKFQCNGKQYAQNTAFHENGNKPRRKGMLHFCRKPEDMFFHYPLFTDEGLTRYANVSAEAYIEDNEVCATNDLFIKNEISVTQLVRQMTYRKPYAFLMDGHAYCRLKLDAFTITNDQELIDFYKDLYKDRIVITHGVCNIWDFGLIQVIIADPDSNLIVNSYRYTIILCDNCKIRYSAGRSYDQCLIVGTNNIVETDSRDVKVVEP